ncbi:MAG: histidine kinase, partial [Oscillospiraceae bacterium]|nr:histidine kinase [Oscillospiraceae bacterium]
MLAKLRRYHIDMSIRYKLLIVSATMILLPVIIFALLVNSVYRSATEEKVAQIVADSSMLVGTNVSRILSDTVNCSNYLTININRSLSGRVGQKLTPVQQLAVTNELYSAQIIFEAIDSIVFMTEYEVLMSDPALLDTPEDIASSPLMERLRETSGGSIWFPCEKRNFLTRNDAESTLTLGKKVLQINTGHTLGYLFINVDLSAINSLLDNQIIGYRLMDGAGMEVGSAMPFGGAGDDDWLWDDESIWEGSGQQIRIKGDRYYAVNRHIPKYGWRLVSTAPLNSFEMNTGNLLLIMVTIVGAALLLEIYLAYYLTRSITTPLQKLKSGAEKIAGGDLKQRMNFKTRDEIGQLGGAFNNMADQIDELLLRVEMEASKKQEYELALLQEQVKPHFLYNTLDLVVILSEMGRERDARQAVRRLASYYRNTLSDSKPIITIKQEMQIVEDYLMLQSMLHSDVFTYEVDMDVSILSVPVPKLTLQPLVENAILHGLQHSAKPGVLRVAGKRGADGVLLSVSDTGVGMSADEQKRVLLSRPQ